MRYVCLLSLTVALFTLSLAQPAAAIPQFYTVYKEEYLDKHADKKYVEEVNKGTAKCLVCHQGKKSRKNHNAFGKPLVDLLDRKKDMKDKKKISEQLKKVLEMHVDPKDKKSETYLDRVKASKWPGGEFKDLEKEPTKEEAEKGGTAAN
jgi:cytochrome c2